MTTKGDLNNLVSTISYTREAAVHMRTGLITDWMLSCLLPSS